MKKMFLIQTLILLALITSACNGTKVETEPVEISIQVPFIVDDQIHSKIYQDAIDNFKKI